MILAEVISNAISVAGIPEVEGGLLMVVEFDILEYKRNIIPEWQRNL